MARFWLVMGSMKPDFTNDDINHYKDESISLFYKKFGELKKIKPEENIRTFSLRLGELFHYIADFFCYAHNNKEMKDNYLQHFKYEWQLNKFAYNTKKDIFKMNISDSFIYNLNLSQIIEYEHKNYLNNKQSFKLDLMSAFKLGILLTNKLIWETNTENNIPYKESPISIAK